METPKHGGFSGVNEFQRIVANGFHNLHLSRVVPSSSANYPLTAYGNDDKDDYFVLLLSSRFAALIRAYAC